MACPVCDGTMQNVGDRSFWCHRCGTIKTGESVDMTAWMREILRGIEPERVGTFCTGRKAHFDIFQQPGVLKVQLLEVER